MLSASLSALASPVFLRVFRSKMMTLPSAPSVMKPRSNSLAIATPWVCLRLEMLPTSALESASMTLTSVPCER